MYQKDYILRLIEEFGRFLRIILRLKNEQQFEAASLQLNEAAEKLLQVNLDELVKDPGNMEQIILVRAFNPDQSDILADLLFLRAEILLETGQKITATRLFEMAKHFLEQNQEKSKTYSLDRIEKIRNIELFLKDLRIE